VPNLLPYTPTAVAETLANALDQAVFKHGYATLAIPGGRSPGPALTALAGMLDSYARSRLHLLWLDERAVPMDHPDRNDAPTLAAWQQGGPLPAHVHPMPADEPDLEAAAERYAQTLASATQGRGLDACLVGIGEDGHLASLFPRHPGLSELAPILAIVDSPKPPPRRLTLSLPVLTKAHLLLILALGAAKGRIARQVAAGPSREIPVSLLPTGRCIWFGDDAAVAAYQA
jgi:6-phosphogluconolactonase